MFLCSCSDEVVLRGLRRGFPCLFLRKSCVTPLVPWSAIVERARRSWEEEFNGDATPEYAELSAATCWLPRFDRGFFPIPYIEFCPEIAPIPSAIWSQLVGQQYGWDGTRISWKGARYVVSASQGVFKFPGTFFVGSEGELEEVPEEMAVGRTFARLVRPTEGTLSMVNERFIDFEK